MHQFLLYEESDASYASTLLYKIALAVVHVWNVFAKCRYRFPTCIYNCTYKSVNCQVSDAKGHLSSLNLLDLNLHAPRLPIPGTVGYTKIISCSEQLNYHAKICYTCWSIDLKQFTRSYSEELSYVTFDNTHVYLSLRASVYWSSL